MNAEEKLAKFIKTPVTINRVKIGKYILNYISAGVGKPLLLIHGANMGWGQWYPNIAELAKKFKIYAIDLPGSGYSSFISFKDNYEEKCIEIIEKFIFAKKLKKLAIVGHSFGGFLALKLTYRNPLLINEIILINPLGFTDYVPNQHKLITISPVVKFLSNVIVKSTRINIIKFVTSVMIKKSYIKEEFIDYYHESITAGRTIHPLFFIHSLFRGFKIRKELVLKNLLEKINKKNLIIVGDKDITMRYILKNNLFYILPHANLKIFPNTGHVPAIEESNKFNKLLVAFLK